MQVAVLTVKLPSESGFIRVRVGRDAKCRQKSTKCTAVLR